MIITNMDAWDRREFLESIEQDERLRDAEIEGTRKQSNYSEFMTDVFGGLYKYEPKQRPESDITPQTEWMDTIYNEIKDLPEWNTLRERTKLNAVASAAATAEFCLQFNDAIPDQGSTKKSDAEYRNKYRQTMQGNKAKQEKVPDVNTTKAGDIDLSAIRRAARQACEAAAKEADKINEAMNAIGQGTTPGQR